MDIDSQTSEADFQSVVAKGVQKGAVGAPKFMQARPFDEDSECTPVQAAAAPEEAASAADWSRSGSPDSGSAGSSFALGASAATLAAGRVASKGCPLLLPPCLAALAATAKLAAMRALLTASLPWAKVGDSAEQVAERGRQASLALVVRGSASSARAAPGPQRAGAGPLSWSGLQRRLASLQCPPKSPLAQSRAAPQARAAAAVAAVQVPTATRKRPAAACSFAKAVKESQKQRRQAEQAQSQSWKGKCWRKQTAAAKAKGGGDKRAKPSQKQRLKAKAAEGQAQWGSQWWAAPVASSAPKAPRPLEEEWPQLHPLAPELVAQFQARKAARIAARSAAIAAPCQPPRATVARAAMPKPQPAAPRQQAARVEQAKAAHLRPLAPRQGQAAGKARLVPRVAVTASLVGQTPPTPTPPKASSTWV